MYYHQPPFTTIETTKDKTKTHFETILKPSIKGPDTPHVNFFQQAAKER
jgi:hypothetical protein